MARRVKRITIYKADHPWLAERQAALERLRRRDLVGVGRDKSISVSPAILDEPLDAEEREVVYKLLGYTWDRRYPLIAKRAGMAGGRAAIAGRRTPVWRIAHRVRSGDTPAAVAAELELEVSQVEQALRYAASHRDEIEQDLLDNQQVEAFRATGSTG